MSPEGAGDAARTGIALVVTTVSDLAAGEVLVRTLVEEQLIACGNLIPGVVSIYRWEGEVSRDPEVVVLMKLPSDSVGRLYQRVSELHPYAVPEVVELPVGRVAAAYHEWVIASTKGSA